MDKRILNVGCGDDTYGTDFVDLYPSRDEVKRCNIDQEKLPFADESFDEVYAKNVLEHLTNVSHFFVECYRVLKDDGTIIIITDNAAYWNFHMPFSVLHHKPLGYSGHGANDKHFSLFTKQHLKNFFEKFGFEVIEMDNYNGYVTWWEKPINFILSFISNKQSYQKIKTMGRKLKK